MTSIFLSCYNMPIIKQVAGILGWVMDLLYKMFSRFGIYNIGLCIIIFTIIVKLLILPMTIKQQKFTKLSSVMNPEIQAVQKKYSGKNDQESMMKMNQELQGIYEKYGTSPTSGCLTILIQMPILFALYGVISQIPTFIPAIGDQFDNAAEIVAEYSDELLPKVTKEVNMKKIGLVHDDLINNKDNQVGERVIDYGNIKITREILANSSIARRLYNKLGQINYKDADMTQSARIKYWNNLYDRAINHKIPNHNEVIEALNVSKEHIKPENYYLLSDFVS